MPAATYARYSSDLQRDSSIDDQIRNCRQWAKRHGLTVSTVYADRAMSGARHDRPDYLRMLADAEAGGFSILIVDDLSRLSRDEIEMKRTLRRLAFLGIRVIGVCDGYDSASKGHKVQAGVRGLVNEIYLDDLADKTHRGLTGRALSGASAGGKSYGYTSRQVGDGWQKTIDPDQAITVRRIFEMFAAGKSPLDIAGELNRAGVPSSRGGKWARSAIYGDRRSGVGILNNPIYIGRLLWNRSQWVKDPDTNKRLRRERPRDEWIEQDAPHLRIIDNMLWQRVQTRINARRYQTNRQHQAGKRSGGGRQPHYLFSGLLVCADCGARFIMANPRSYGCATNKERGKNACKNTLYVRRDVLESRLLTSIKNELLNDEALALFKQETSRLLREASKQQPAENIEKQIARLDREIGNMLDAIAQGYASEALKQRLVDTENRRADLVELVRVQTRPDRGLPDFLPDVAAQYREMIEGLENELTADIGIAREQLKILLGETILLRRHPGGYLQAEIGADLVGLLKQAAGASFLVVAGAGFGHYRHLVDLK